MINKAFIKHLDKINSTLGLDVVIRNDLFVLDNAYFTNFKRMIGYADKSFEIIDHMKDNRALNCIMSAYGKEETPEFANYEWTSSSHKYLNDDNVYVDENGSYVAIRDFRIEMSWGIAFVKKSNRLISVYTVDGLETGVLITNSVTDPVVFCPDLNYIRPLNYDPASAKAVLQKVYTSKSLTLVSTNIMPAVLVSSLVNLCKAGVINDISCSGPQERLLTVAFVREATPPSLPYLRVNGMNVLSLVDKYILSMSNKEIRSAVTLAMDASVSLNVPIPKVIAGVMASRSQTKACVPKDVKLFVFNILDTFFTVARFSYPVISERYGKKDYHYRSIADNNAARKIAKNIRRIDGASDKLSAIPLADIISIIHEYVQSEHTPEKPAEEGFSFGGVTMFTNYKDSCLRFSTVPGEHVTKSARWIGSHRWQPTPREATARAETYNFIFKESSDMQKAVMATYGLALATLMDVKYEIKVCAISKLAKKNTIRFFESTGFNPFSLVVKEAGILTMKYNDICVVNENNTHMYPGSKRKLIFVSHESDADICMSELQPSSAQYSQTYRLSTCTPDKRYIFDFAEVLTRMVTTFPTDGHASEMLGTRTKIDNFILAN